MPEATPGVYVDMWGPYYTEAKDVIIPGVGGNQGFRFYNNGNERIEGGGVSNSKYTMSEDEGTFTNQWEYRSYYKASNSIYYTEYGFYTSVDGSNSADTIVGSTVQDNINGWNGNDLILGDTRQTLGKDPDDTSNQWDDILSNMEIVSNDLGDIISDDYINGGNGNDTIYGEVGDDIIDGGKGKDIIFGGIGDDKLNGENWKDILHGQEGSDTLRGGDGADILVTGDLSDGQSDVLDGGNGRDTFVLGVVDEGMTIEGSGIDWSNLALSLAGDVSDFMFQYSGVGDTGKLIKEVVPMAFDFIKAMNGADGKVIKEPAVGKYATVEDFNPREDVVVVPLPDGASNVFLSTDTNGENSISFKYDSDDDSDGVFAVLNFSDTYLDDGTTLNATSRSRIADQLINNALIFDSSDVTLGSGETVELDQNLDLSSIGNNKYLVLGAYSSAFLEGGNTADYLYGTNNDDVLSGFQLAPGGGQSNNPENAGTDEFYGFNGNDIFFGGKSGAGVDMLFGGNGSDTSSYAYSPAGIYVDLSIFNTDSNGTYVIANDGHGTQDNLYSVENIVGSDYEDTVAFTQAVGSINATFGMDSDGRSVIEVRNGQVFEDNLGTMTNIENIVGSGYTDKADFSDVVGPLNITINSQNIATVVDGNSLTHTLQNFDTFIGTSSSNDTVYLDKNLDPRDFNFQQIENIHTNLHLLGTDGDDELVGEMGNDVITGFAGDDTLKGNAVNYKRGYDLIDYADNPAQPEQGITIILKNDYAEDAFGGQDLIAEETISAVSGTSANDKIIVDATDSSWWGFEIDLFGEAGNDTLTGSGNDQELDGGEGDDILNGMSGDDILTGGPGADTFSFIPYFSSPLGGTDTITDFSAFEGDVIEIEKEAYGISKVSDLYYNSWTDALMVKGDNNPIAIIEGSSDFSVSDSTISLV